MNNTIYIVVIVFLLLFDFFLTYFRNPKRIPKGDYTKCFQSSMLLTKHEWSNFIKLRAILEPKGLYICPKVRLLDLVTPKKGLNKATYQAAFNKVSSKHIDFVICDKSMHIKLCLELDDSSHTAPSRQERDNFVDTILTNTGYKILHVWDVEKELSNILSALCINQEDHIAN